MPTGYTAMLDDNPELSTAQWMKEGIVRNFGVCVTLRDSKHDLDEKEIEKLLEENIEQSAKWYREKLVDTKNTIAEMEQNPERFFSKEYADYLERTESYNKQSKAEANTNQERHNAVIMDLKKVIQNTNDEVTQNLAKFGIEQLELVKSDRTPYIIELKSFLEFKDEKKKSLDRDLDYYQKNLNEIIKRETDRLNAYKKIVSEVNRILSVNTHETRSTEDKKDA